MSGHRSFRLTRGSGTPDDSVVIGSFREAVRFTLLLQVPLLLITAMILDGGMIFRRLAKASVAYWIFVLIIRFRRGAEMPDSDTLLVKWGYLPTLLITCIMWRIGSTILTALP